MSLKVWLPLNGNLENIGCSNITVTNNGATVNASGKIGQCYCPATMTLTNLGNLSFDNSSYCFWAKTSSTSGWQLIIGIDNTSNSQIHGIYIADSTRLKLEYNPSLNIYNSATASWHHYAFVIKNGKSQCYYDGVLATTSTEAVTNDTIGRLRLGVGTAISLNDIRIYDHCLSAAEVHEISQGLVLHYKLDDTVGMTDLITRGVKPNIYNNHNNTNMPSTLVENGSYNGDIIWRGTYTPTANSLSSIQSNLGSHGIYNWSRTFKANTKYVFWIYYKPISNSDTRCGGTASNIGGWTEIAPVAVGDGWYRVGQYRNGTVTSDKTDNIFVSFKVPSAVSGTPIIIDWASPHILEGTTEIPPYDYFSSTIIDSSGHGYNSTLTGTGSISSTSGRYSNCLHFGAHQAPYTTLNTTSFLSALSNCTVTYWCKHDNTSNSLSFTGQDTSHYLMATNSSSNYYHGTSGTITVYRDGVAGAYKSIANEWHHLALTGVNLSGWTQFKINSYASSWPLNAYISDLRIYATQLSAADIKALYEVGAKVDNLGGLHTFEAVENMHNIIFKTDSARAAKVFQDGLSSYTQANCQVTLTDNGYRIYRPPNLTTSANGNTMWGGLKLVNQTSDTVSAYTTPRDNCWNLQQNHTYLCAFHAKGQSSNGTTFSWTNNMGWGGGGVSPSPTIIINDGIPNNFQGEKDCIFIFTIGDTISKACTSAYSSYAAGTTYLSYRHLTFGWGYTSTGSLGTDIYLTNLRLYDITNFIGKIKKTGQANFGDFVENNSIARILKNAEFLTNNLIEL